MRLYPPDESTAVFSENVFLMMGIFVFLLIYRYRLTLLQKLTLGFFYMVSIIGFLVGPYGAPWVSKYLEMILPRVPSTPVVPGDVSDGVVEDIVIESGGSSGSVFAQTFAAEYLDAWNQILIGEFGISAWFSFISTAMLIVFILFGIYCLLSPKMMNKKIAVFGMFGIVLTLVFAPHAAEIVESWLSADLELDRLRLVISPVYAVIMAVGCAVIATLLSSRKPRSSSKGIAVVTLLCIALVVASRVLAESRDSTVFDGWMIADTDYFTESEIAALETVEMYVPAGSSVYSDYRVMRYYPSSKGYLNYDMTYLSFKKGGDKLYSERVGASGMAEYVIMRDWRYEESGLSCVDSSGDTVKIYPNDVSLVIFSENTFVMNGVYSNNGVVLLH